MLANWPPLVYTPSASGGYPSNSFSQSIDWTSTAVAAGPPRHSPMFGLMADVTKSPTTPTGFGDEVM
jgi:hypothetical protein